MVNPSPTGHLDCRSPIPRREHSAYGAAFVAGVRQVTLHFDQRRLSKERTAHIPRVVKERNGNRFEGPVVLIAGACRSNASRGLGTAHNATNNGPGRTSRFAVTGAAAAIATRDVARATVAVVGHEIDTAVSTDRPRTLRRLAVRPVGARQNGDGFRAGKLEEATEHEESKNISHDQENPQPGRMAQRSASIDRAGRATGSGEPNWHARGSLT